jgi:TRAP-type C4-dicarboxylate transport system permease small subunit
MKAIEKLIRKLSNLSGYISGLILILIILLTMAEVVSRYVMKNPLILCDEFGGYSLVLITFFGLAYCWQEKGHIRITFLVDRLPMKVEKIIRIFSLAAIAVYIGIATKMSWIFLIGAFKRNIRSNSFLMTPLKWPQMAIPIGFSLLLLVVLMHLYKVIAQQNVDSTEEVKKLDHDGI